MLLLKRKSDLSLEFGHWMEANFVVLGEGDMLDHATKYLIRDPCTCTTFYLPEAVRIADEKGITVKDRIRQLARKAAESLLAEKSAEPTE